MAAALLLAPILGPGTGYATEPLDAQVTTGAVPVPGNTGGTVATRQTGLQWETTATMASAVICGAAGCLDLHDVQDNYVWSNTGTDRDGGAFKDFLARLNATFEPQNPRCTHVASVADAGATSFYWPASPGVKKTANTGITLFADGSMTNFFKTALTYVRAVRAGSSCD